MQKINKPGMSEMILKLSEKKVKKDWSMWGLYYGIFIGIIIGMVLGYVICGIIVVRYGKK
jgi:tetrahydromethanopterin S-methyltransferase subunit G